MKSIAFRDGYAEKKIFETALVEPEQLTIRKLSTHASKTTARDQMAGVPVCEHVPVQELRIASSTEVAEEALALTPEFFAQMGHLIECMQPALGSNDAGFSAQGKQLIHALKQPFPDLATAKPLLANYSHSLSFAAQEQAKILSALLKLLHLVFENIGDLSIDEQWLKGQMGALKAASAPPLSLHRLDNVENLLKAVIGRQKDAREKASLAHLEMRQMLAAFIDRLSQISQSTGSFQGKMEESARLIENARSIDEIAPVLKDVVGATRNIASDTLAARDELQSMREQANSRQAEIAKLHQELDRISTQSRHDSLTGALNRRGLEEALEKEISTVRRRETPLSVGLLDIDDFKALNDSLGHATGDCALMHLAQVVRECMRPQDTLARYGGEEFVVLLPETSMEKGVVAVTRLQRELAKRFFMAGTEKVLITFSAGVAQLNNDEPGMDAIRRADQAMYMAKRLGKNRVIGT